MSIGTEIKALREAAGISICELERRCGISKSHISAIERGKADERNCSIKTLEDIVEALGGDFVYYIAQ